ncbi:glycosyl transferase family 1 [Sphingomonas melonis]|uniref:Glycosyl transferase family 1 n=1 Tax=Sphingomonas melonis TaxID=152682 RepID=A0A0D1M5C1_9SPHN|nr:glycosyltransferase [Sphingomonas melonis]KIU26017.1 glycosyl transferase family 1 [Sphingomonas melonis]
MRIIDVCPFYSPAGGGVRTYVHQKLKAAAAMGHEMIVLVPGVRHDVTEVDGGVIASIAGPRLPFDRRYGYFHDEEAVHRFLNAWAPDVVEASSPWASAAMVGRWPGAAIRSLVMHADPMSAYAYRWFGRIASLSTIDRGFSRFWRHLRALDSRMDMVVSASPDLSRRLVDGGLRRVITVPMGVQSGLFSPSLRDEGLRAELLRRCGLPPSGLLLLGVGRYSPEKRWPMVIDAAVAAGVRHAVGLVLVGDGRSRRGLEGRAAGSPHVVIGGPIGERRTLARMLASADALVHGCEAETFCMVGAEAVASGLPVIAPDRGGAADHVREPHGRRYRAADPVALRDAILDTAASLTAGRPVPTAAVRTEREHFEALFGAYASGRQTGRLAA